MLLKFKGEAELGLPFETNKMYNIQLIYNFYMDCIELYYENNLIKWYSTIPEIKKDWQGVDNNWVKR